MGNKHTFVPFNTTMSIELQKRIKELSNNKEI